MEHLAAKQTATSLRNWWRENWKKQSKKRANIGLSVAESLKSDMRQHKHTNCLPSFRYSMKLNVIFSCICVLYDFIKKAEFSIQLMTSSRWLSSWWNLEGKIHSSCTHRWRSSWPSGIRRWGGARTACPAEPWPPRWRAAGWWACPARRWAGLCGVWRGWTWCHRGVEVLGCG